MKVFHFAADKLRDGTPLPKKGDALPHIDNPIPCERGWHGSVRAIDALAYAPGCMVALRDLQGIVLTHGEPVDKHCASDAAMLTGYVDARPVLVAFARWAALRALRIHAPAALRKAGLTEQADKLAALPDDCDLHAAARAAGAAGAAAAAAERGIQNEWLENALSKLLGAQP